MTRVTVYLILRFRPRYAGERLPAGSNVAGHQSFQLHQRLHQLEARTGGGGNKEPMDRTHKNS
jgi:hypothetical protein